MRMKTFVTAALVLWIGIAEALAQNVERSRVVVPSSTSSSWFRGADGSASEPTYSWSNDTDTGLFRSAANRTAVSGGGSAILEWGNGAQTMVSGTILGWNSSASDTTVAADTILVRDAANTLAQRNGTSAQTFNVYNTYTSSTNKEFGALRWASNRFQIWTDVGSGGGTARSMDMVSTGSDMTFYVGGSAAGNKVINLTGAGVMFPNDNLYDIGASGANRPKNLYLAGTSYADTMAFASETNTSISYGGGSIISFNLAGNTRARIDGVGAYYGLSLGANALKFGSSITSVDVEVFRGAANRLDLASGDSLNLVSGNISIGTGYLLTGAVAVGSLPSCVSGLKGARLFVTDSNAASYTAGIGAVVAAGGSTNVPVTCDGTNWRIG